MKRKALVGVFLVCFAVGIFSIAPSVSSGEDNVVATVIDINGAEHTNIHDLRLYWTSGYYYDYENSILVRKGESELTIPINKIKEIEFAWDETPTVTVTALSGEKIKGEPLRVADWYFKGKTDFGDFKLSVSKTKKVILEGGVPSIDLNEDEDKIVVTVMDINGAEHTNIHDLRLYWTSGHYYDYENSILVRKGESELTIPINKIKEIEFAWDEMPTVTVTALSGEKIKGEPLRVSDWYFKGKTDFGDFKLSVSKTKKVMTSHEVTSTSPIPTQVITMPTPTLAPAQRPSTTSTPVPSSAPTLTPVQTPTPSPNEIPTPIPMPAGFEVVFVIAGLFAIAYILRRNKK